MKRVMGIILVCLTVAGFIDKSDAYASEEKSTVTFQYSQNLETQDERDTADKICQKRAELKNQTCWFTGSDQEINDLMESVFSDYWQEIVDDRPKCTEPVWVLNMWGNRWIVKIETFDDCAPNFDYHHGDRLILFMLPQDDQGISWQERCDLYGGVTIETELFNICDNVDS